MVDFHGSQPGAEHRERLAFALQNAYTSHRYNSPLVRLAVREFVDTARHMGLSLDWVLVAIQDVIDASILPRLQGGNRDSFSTPIRRLAEEMYTRSQGVTATRAEIKTAGRAVGRSVGDPGSRSKPR